MRKSELRCLMLTAIALVMLAGCGTEPQSGPAELKVGYLPIAECAHLYVAISEGYFEAENLSVSLQPMRGGATILPALQQGDLDVGFTNVVSLIMLNSQLEASSPDWLLSIGGATYERPGFTNHALLARSATATTEMDLDPQKIRIAVNTTRNIEELMLRAYLERKGLPQERLNLVELAFPEMVPALRREEIDIASVVEPFIEPPLQSGEFRKVANQYQEVSDDTLVATYAATREWLRNNEEASRGFQRALELADEFIASNDSQTREIIGTFTRISQNDLPIIGLPAFEAHTNQQAMRRLATLMKRFHFIDEAPDVASMLYQSENQDGAPQG